MQCVNACPCSGVNVRHAQDFVVKYAVTVCHATCPVASQHQYSLLSVLAFALLLLTCSDASNSLALPSLLCLGTMCTGYMRALDYSGDVVEAGGVPAMLSYLRKAGKEGRQVRQPGPGKEACGGFEIGA